MLYNINSLSDPYITYIADDPVRPNIAVESRIGFGRYVFALLEDNNPQAITCVALCDRIPVVDRELFMCYDCAHIAVFYTIWSYQSGSARTLLFSVVDYLKMVRPSITRFITLSPKTEMAYKFHTKNGAIILQENNITINYEYPRLDC